MSIEAGRGGGAARGAAADDTSSPPRLADLVQANLARVTWQAGRQDITIGKRDWALFAFFRILGDEEMRQSIALLGQLFSDAEGQSEASGPPHADAISRDARLRAVLANWGNPALFAEIGAQAESAAEDKPSARRDPRAFRAWLALLTDKNSQPFLSFLKDCVVPALALGARQDQQSRADRLIELIENHLLAPDGSASGCNEADLHAEPSSAAITTLLSGLRKILGCDGPVEHLETILGNSPECAGASALREGLVGLLVHEVLRQLLPAFISELPAAVRSETDQENAREQTFSFDAVPVNVAFTQAGLCALRIDEATLASFPEPFRQGMAWRSARLGDTGDNAPESWDGALGQHHVHGLFTSYFQIDGASEAEWQAVRDDVHAFNARDERGRRLRELVGGLFRLFGLEVVHIELGERPYREIREGRRIPHRPYPVEHFGFRDGIGQPEIELGLEASGERWSQSARSRTRAPIAPGEIYLGSPDEDGRCILHPFNEDLRVGGTYLVFRKLEQDVVGFRNFLRRARPGDKEAQKRLKAELMGRWPNGSDLVRHPHFETVVDEDLLDSFLFAADDPNGEKCPLGAHVRRANPRDIGRRNDSRRHRILRRSIAFGGALLPEDASDDLRKRGLLFIALNARIEMQFEIIQGRWLNAGEFLGQAGLEKCPIAGSNTGAASDRFFERAALSPLTHLPAFVTMKGGDYFFVPSLHALRQMACGASFPACAHHPGPSFSAFRTPALFDRQRLHAYGRRILSPKAPHKVSVDLPDAVFGDRRTHRPNESEDQARRMTFIGQHRHVRKVLSGLPLKGGDPNKTPFSVRHYLSAGNEMAHGQVFLSSTDLNLTPQLRAELRTVLGAACKRLACARGNLLDEMTRLCATSHRRTIGRLHKTGEVDLVRDVAAEACYDIMTELFGVDGPDHVTEIAAALPFARQHLGQVHPDWLEQLERQAPHNPGLTTLQLWSILQMMGLVGNVRFDHDLTNLTRQGCGELRNHIHARIDHVLLDPPDEPATLLQAMVLEAYDAKLTGEALHRRKSIITALLAELSGFFMGGIPSVFGEIMDAALTMRLDITRCVDILGRDKPYLLPGDEASDYFASGLHHFIHEMIRLHPSPAIMFRFCEQDHDFGDGLSLAAGDWIACLISAANLDPCVQGDAPRDAPHKFSLYPWLPGPKRRQQDFLMFGPFGGDRVCWGREPALHVMSECLRCSAEFQGLQRVAGPAGEIEDLVRIKIGLQARFPPFDTLARTAST